ncbi:MAG: hypothetical protein ABL952_05720 [Pyrinomonadaceae bacterium]
MSSVENEKQYSLTTENRGEYLYANVGGLRVTPEIALDYWHEIIDECDDLGLSKILLEHSFVEMISVEGMLDVIGPLGGLLKGRMFAFIDDFGHYEIPEAAKAILRGLHVKMQLFEDIEKAEKWLIANSPAV